jgi:hypothetical protein
MAPPPEEYLASPQHQKQVWAPVFSSPPVDRSSQPQAGASALEDMFGYARKLIAERTLRNVSPEEATRQRQATLAALESLARDPAQLEHPAGPDAAHVN